MTKDHWANYLIEGTNVLKNNLGITNKNKLLEAERQITKKSLALIYLNPVCTNFDIENLKKVHKEIFKNIYPFAGEFRLCTLGKENTAFSLPENIEKNLNEILTKLNNIPDINSISELAFHIAPLYHDMIIIHPFREGNGRTIRVFFREFILEKTKTLSCGPLDIDYSKMDSNNLLTGTIERYLYPSLLEMEFLKGLVPVQKENNHQVR